MRSRSRRAQNRPSVRCRTTGPRTGWAMPTSGRPAAEAIPDKVAGLPVSRGTAGCDGRRGLPCVWAVPARRREVRLALPRERRRRSGPRITIRYARGHGASKPPAQHRCRPHAHRSWSPWRSGTGAVRAPDASRLALRGPRRTWRGRSGELRPLCSGGRPERRPPHVIPVSSADPDC